MPYLFFILINFPFQIHLISVLYTMTASATQSYCLYIVTENMIVDVDIILKLAPYIYVIKELNSILKTNIKYQEPIILINGIST